MTVARVGAFQLRTLRSKSNAQVAGFYVRVLSVYTAPSAAVKAWTGSAYVDAPVKVWNGTAFVDALTVKTWNGSAFV